MSSSNRDLEEQAKMLPEKDRARLALRLIESLDPGTDEDAEALWLDEADKRLKAYDAGETRSRPVNDVIAEIKSGLSNVISNSSASFRRAGSLRQLLQFSTIESRNRVFG